MSATPPTDAAARPEPGWNRTMAQHRMAVEQGRTTRDGAAEVEKLVAAIGDARIREWLSLALADDLTL